MRREDEDQDAGNEERVENSGMFLLLDCGRGSNEDPTRDVSSLSLPHVTLHHLDKSDKIHVSLSGTFSRNQGNYLG